MEVDTVQRAPAYAASRRLRVAPEVITADAAVGDEPFQRFDGQLAAGIHAALVDGILIDLGGVDTVESGHGAVDRERIGVAGAGRREREQEKGSISKRRIETAVGN